MSWRLQPGEEQRAAACPAGVDAACGLPRGQAPKLPANLQRWESSVWAANFVMGFFVKCNLCHSFLQCVFFPRGHLAVFICSRWEPPSYLGFNFSLLKEITEEEGLRAGRESAFVDKYPSCICTVSHSWILKPLLLGILKQHLVIFSSLYNVRLKCCLIFIGAIVLVCFPPRKKDTQVALQWEVYWVHIMHTWIRNK